MGRSMLLDSIYGVCWVLRLDLCHLRAHWANWALYLLILRLVSRLVYWLIGVNWHGLLYLPRRLVYWLIDVGWHRLLYLLL